jgi:hypothetical protein
MLDHAASEPVDDISDEELTELALAADPNQSLQDARPIAEVIGRGGESTLPEWYMPAVMGGGLHLSGWRRGLIFTFITALVVIEAFGLCSTYGQIL